MRSGRSTARLTVKFLVSAPPVSRGNGPSKTPTRHGGVVLHPQKKGCLGTVCHSTTTATATSSLAITHEQLPEGVPQCQRVLFELFLGSRLEAAVRQFSPAKASVSVKHTLNLSIALLSLEAQSCGTLRMQHSVSP